MSFIDQFNDLPENISFNFLKKIFSNYKSLLSRIKHVREVENTDSIREGEFYIKYCYDLNDEMFLYYINTQDNTVIVKFINRAKYIETGEIELVSQKSGECGFILYNQDDDEYRITYFQNADMNVNEKSTTYHYKLLNYKNEIKSFLREIEIRDYSGGSSTALNITNTCVKKVWILYGNLHRRNAPAEMIYTKNESRLLSERWFTYGRMHRKDGPAEVVYDQLGRLKKEAWYMRGVKHNKTNPSEIYYRLEDNKKIIVWYNEDEPLKVEEEMLSVKND